MNSPGPLSVELRASFVAAAAALLTGCGNGGGAPPAPTDQAPAPPSAAGPAQFTDVTEASGINYEVGFQNRPANEDVERIASSGVAAGDYDGDGDTDLFIVRGDIGPNLLYRNIGNLTFEEVAAAAGLAFTKSATENYRHGGPTFADLDGDADLDLFIGGLAGDPALIFANNGNGTFVDVTTGSGIDGMAAEYTLSAAFGDYDLDGDLDLFLAHWGTPRDFVRPGDTEHLWRNDSDAAGIRFTSVSVAAGISPSILTLPDPNVTETAWDYTFSPTFARINDDAYPDILSVADFDYSQVFLNNGDGTFDNATNTDVIIDGNGMGSAVGDYDNDGDLDWFVSSIAANPESPVAGLSTLGNRLYRNNNGLFEDATDEAGVASGGWGWGACFLDIENDGDLDIYHTNGWDLDNDAGDFRNDASRAFVSNGSGSFQEQAETLGLADTEQGRGVVCADFDQDGDTDILQLHQAPRLSATLWQNGTSGNNYLAVRLNGRPPNTQAAGARIRLRIGANEQLREIVIGSNFASQNPVKQIFGLGSSTQADELNVTWPDGARTRMLNVTADQTLTLNHPSL